MHSKLLGTTLDSTVRSVGKLLAIFDILEGFQKNILYVYRNSLERKNFEFLRANHLSNLEFRKEPVKLWNSYL